MRDNLFFHLVLLNFFSNGKKHLISIFFSVLLLFFLMSTLFISDSIEFMLKNQFKTQSDFIAKRVLAGNFAPVTQKYLEKIQNTFGVENVNGRVFGRYFFDKSHWALIVGIDPLEEQVQKNLEQILDKKSAKAFLSQNVMIVGKGVQDYLQKHYFKNFYSFLNPKGEIIKVKLLKSINTFGFNSVIFMPKELARAVLGLKQNQFSDIVFSVPNKKEWNNIQNKIDGYFFDIMLFNKDELQKVYIKNINFKGGFFLSLYISAILAFIMLLYNQYNFIFSHEKRSVAIYRTLGFSIKKLLLLKLCEIFIVIAISYIGAFFLSYFYVFWLHAPILKLIFLGSDNLRAFSPLYPALDFSTLFSIFLLFSLSFFTATILPLWHVAISEAKEVLL